MVDIHKREVGKTFQFLCEKDLTGVQNLTAEVKKPSGKISMWSPSAYGDPTLGIARYSTVSGDLNEPGWYFLQMYGEWSGGARVAIGRTVKFKVLDDFEVPP